MQGDYENDEVEGVEYPPSDRDNKKPSNLVYPSKSNTIMKPTISQTNKVVKPPKNLKENQSKPSNSIPPKKDFPPQVHISLKKYVNTSPQATKTVSYLNTQSNNQPIYTQSNYSVQSQSQINKNPNNSNFQKINSENMNDANHSYQEYNDLFQAHQQILIKHSKLEETLRNETINSEEQRSYIEILKQALEEKLITNELWHDFKGTQGPHNHSPVDFYLEMTKMKQTLEQREQEFEEAIRSMEEFKNQLELTLNSNQELEEKQVKLIEEKESLLEYLDELKGNFMTIEQQNQQYETIINSLSHEKEEIKGYYEDLKPQLEEKMDENNRLNEELLSEKVLAKEIESHRQKLLSKNEELESEIHELKSTDNLKQEINKLKNELASLDNEKINLLEKLRISNENFSTVKCTLQETQSDLDKALEKINSLNEEYTKTKEIQLKYQDLELNYLALKEEFEGISQTKKDELSRIENDRLKKMEEIKGIYQQLSQNRSEMRILKDELSKLENDKIYQNQEIETCSQQNEHQKSQISSLESEIQEYKKILQDRDLSSAKLHTLSIKYQADKEYFEESMKELKRKNNEITLENEHLLKELNQNREKAQTLEENLERFSAKNNKNVSISMEQAFKYVNSMIMDLKRHLGNTKLTRGNEKFDLESSLLELHELIIMCLERFEEISSNTLNKKQILEEKDQEIRVLHEKLESYEANFERNIEIFEKEKEELVMKYENEHKDIVQEIKKQEEIRLKSLESELKFENEQIKEISNRIKKEKTCYEYLLKKFKGLLIEDEVKKLFEELIQVNFDIFEHEMKKTELQVKLDQISQQKMKENYYDINNLKDNLYEIQKSLERLYEKKKLYETELQKLELIDRKRIEELKETKTKKMIKTNSESNLRAIFEETRGTDNSLISNKNFESKLSSIKDEKMANKPQIYNREYSTSKYVSYQDKFEKGGSMYEKPNNVSLENPIYNNLNELRSKFSKKPWIGLNYYDEK